MMDMSLLELIAKLLAALKTISNTCGRLQTTGFKDIVQRLEWSSADPVKQCMLNQRPRTRSSVTIWSLPDFVLVHILKELRVQDLLSFKSVHPHFCNIIEANSSLWKNVSFAETWPSAKTLHHFINAAEKKNVEASIKLAVAYLYKEGLCEDDDTDVSYKSAHYFCLAEILTPEAFPFFWIFIRPPWSLDGTCCKAKTFQEIQIIAEKTNHPDLCFGTGLTLKLQRLTTHGISKVEEMKYFNMAVGKNSKAAAFFILLDFEKEMDKAKELERVRMLRLISSSVLEAKLFLIRHYVKGHYGGITCQMAQEYVRNSFQTSQPSRIHITYSKGQTSDISRFIVVDWLVEVLGMKEYSTHTLYLAVSMFDRFLQLRTIQRSQVQLLGVAAMVISSRYLGFNILTIREAAWLTDNSYSYQDVVRMMGELAAALAGNLRVLNIHDYVMVLAPLIGETCQSAMLMEYLAMLCLLQSEMGQYSPAEIAASCLLLARLLLNCDDPWPVTVQEWTGFTQDYLSLCTFHIYNKCLVEGSEVEYKGAKLQSVKARYADPNRYGVSKIKVIHHNELCKRLGVAKLITRGRETKAVKFRNTDELIMSPSRSQRSEFASMEESFTLPFESFDRKLSATPPISMDGACDEPGSGYDGDLDISDESFLSKLGLNEDSEPDLSDSVMEESHDWDEPSADDTEDDSLTGSKSSVLFSNISDHLEKHAERFSWQPPSIANLVPCLSSMCQVGTKVNCYSSSSSPSSCVANCWCKRSAAATEEATFAVGSAPEARTPGSRSSDASDSNQAMKSPLASSGTVAQNVRACIPSGSIGKVHKKDKLGSSSRNCNISSHHDAVCRSTKGQPFTRSKCIQNLSYCDTSRGDNSTVVYCEKNPSPYLLEKSQKTMCNHLDRSQQSGQYFQGSKAKCSVLSGDILPPCSISYTASACSDESLSLSSTPPSTSCVSSLPSTSAATCSQSDANIIPLNCDLISDLFPNQNGFQSSELGDNTLLFHLSDTPKTGKSCAKHKGKAGKRVSEPATPENSMDSFTTSSSQVGALQTLPQFAISHVSCTSASALSKKARLDVSNSHVSGCDGLENSSLKCSRGDIANSSVTEFAQHSTPPREKTSTDVGPVLRRKRKYSDSE